MKHLKATHLNTPCNPLCNHSCNPSESLLYACRSVLVICPTESVTIKLQATAYGAFSVSAVCQNYANFVERNTQAPNNNRRDKVTRERRSKRDSIK